MINRKILVLILVVIFLPFSSVSAGSKEESLKKRVRFRPLKVIEDHWYAYYMAGKKIGYINEKVTLGSIGDIECYQSSTSSFYRLVRFGHDMTVRKLSLVAEDTEGKLIEFYVYSKSSRVPTEVYGENTDGLIKYEKKTGSEVKWSTVVIEDDVLMPYGAKKFGEKMGLARGTVYSMKTFRPSADSMTILKMKVHVHDKERVVYFDTNKYLHKVSAELKNFPGLVMQYWSDESGTVWKINPGVMNMECLLVTREAALKEADSYDIAMATAVKPDRPIPEPEKVKAAVFEITGKKGIRVNLPDNSFQNTERTGSNSVLLRTNIVSPDRELTFAGLGLISGMEEYLAPGHYIQSSSDKVRMYARAIVKDDENVWNSVRKIRKWVSENVRKRNYNVGYATSLEVLDRMEGDCTEHSILFTALARASGIPARVVFGMTYANMKSGPAFAFHQWCEVWVGRWVAVDPAMNQDIADATHIVFVETSLGDRRAQGRIGMSILKLLGNMNIKVKSFR